MEIKDTVLVVCDVQMCFLSYYILLCILCCDSSHANKLILPYLNKVTSPSSRSDLPITSLAVCTIIPQLPIESKYGV